MSGRTEWTGTVTVRSAEGSNGSSDDGMHAQREERRLASTTRGLLGGSLYGRQSRVASVPQARRGGKASTPGQGGYVIPM
ncbi:hypothetical protein E2C01_064519 [Portunus trituberculatus]|uniref:Uncharacterized protein n=1 Tax=Portunus trituberculatus TaxID=210409 RepID=A0A5B7HM18_PORTR|nr:hypothetical protein [Portunus trituberculatus]